MLKQDTPETAVYESAIVRMCKLRVGELILLLSFFLLAYKGVFTPISHKIQVPEITVNIDGKTITFKDPEHSFPLKVGGKWCVADDFDACPGVQPVSEGCCADEDYWEEVTGNDLHLLCYFAPLAFVFLRAILFRLCRRTGSKIEFQDAMVGLLGSWFLMIIWTGVFKNIIGYPRPNYYALAAYGKLHHTSGPLGTMNRSFPSGHSSESMTGMAFITFILLEDVKLLHLQNKLIDGLCRSVVYVLAIAPLLVACWVGATRVRDFFHFPVDVVAGLAIGLGVSYFGTHVLTRKLFDFSNVFQSSEDQLLRKPLLEANLFEV